LPATEELLEDDATAAGYINQRLATFTQAELDNQLLNGDGTGQNLLGFHSAGIGSSTYAPGATWQERIALILGAAGSVATDGRAVADSVVIGASDWWGLLSAQTSTGDFVFEPGSPPQSVFGLQPIVTINQV